MSGAPKLQQSLESVVPVDDAAIEVVEVGGRKTATVELHHRAQIRRNDWQRSEDHPLRLVATLAQRLNDAQSLRGLLDLDFGC